MANFRTITARFPALAAAAGGQYCVGQRIRFGGKGMTYHLKAECGAARPRALPTPLRATTGNRSSALA